MENDTHVSLSKTWSDGLVVKLVGGNHSLGYMRTKLQQKWAPKDQWQQVGLDNNFFAVRFKNPDDKLFYLTGGPWMIGGHYLTVQQWRPDFCATDEVIDRVAVWVRITILPLEYMNSAFLRKFGNTMGTLFKIGINTSQQERGRFVRFCVEIDLNKPLKTYIRKNNRWYKLEYEELNLVCFDCGRFGHTKEGCKGKKADEVIPENREEIRPETNSVKTTSNSQEVPEFGPWMLVSHSYKERKNYNFTGVKGKSSVMESKDGSRFGVLSEQGEDLTEDEPEPSHGKLHLPETEQAQVPRPRKKQSAKSALKLKQRPTTKDKLNKKSATFVKQKEPVATSSSFVTQKSTIDCNPKASYLNKLTQARNTFATQMNPHLNYIAPSPSHQHGKLENKAKDFSCFGQNLQGRTLPGTLIGS